MYHPHPQSSHTCYFKGLSYTLHYVVHAPPSIEGGANFGSRRQQQEQKIVKLDRPLEIGFRCKSARAVH